MGKIAVLITVFNRIESTLKCLECLFNQKSLVGIDLDVFLVDDGSTDNSSLIIQKEFPKVNLIKGNGNLYWNRGMCLAWDTAVSCKEYDAFLWLNNDTFLFEDAIAMLWNSAIETQMSALLCGSICSVKDKSILTYGGGFVDSNNKLVLNYPKGSLRRAQIINGNCVLVPRNIFLRLGTLDKKFSHALGDFDYGLRAVKEGIPVYTTDFVGSCEKNLSVPVWQDARNNIFKRIKNLYSPLGRSEPHKFFIYSSRHFGVMKASKVFTSQNIRVLFPGVWFWLNQKRKSKI